MNDTPVFFLERLFPSRVTKFRPSGLCLWLFAELSTLLPTPLIRFLFTFNLADAL